MKAQSPAAEDFHSVDYNFQKKIEPSKSMIERFPGNMPDLEIVMGIMKIGTIITLQDSSPFQGLSKARRSFFSTFNDQSSDWATH